MSEHAAKIRIAINTRHLIPERMEGIGRFVQQNFSRIARWNPEIEFHFIFDRPWDNSFITSPNIIPHYIFPPVRHPYVLRFWYDFQVPRLLKKIKADLFVSPDNFSSLKTKIPTVTVIHDLAFEHYPDDIARLFAKFYRKYTPLYVKNAVRVITVSEFSAADIAEKYETDRSKIDVVYSAADDRFCPLDAEVINSVRQQYAKGMPYFLFVGSLHPRKNLINLFKAYQLYRQHSDFKIPLLIAGAKYYWPDELEQCYKSNLYREDIIFTGRLSDNDLHRIIASAFGLTFVSYFEGFGVPPLEAFACGVPVIAGNRTAVPEITADAAFQIDPFNPEDIAHAMQLLTTNEELRERLINKGYKRIQDFSWDITAKLVWQSIEKALSKIQS